MSEVFRSIRDFLFSIMNKQFFVFLFFLLLSAVIWLIMTLNETYEKELEVPVRITNIPKNVVLTSASIDTIHVTVRDKGWLLLSYLYGERRAALNINYKNYDRGNGGGIVSGAELKRMAEQKLEMSTKIITIKPEKLEFFYNNGERKRVPVYWTGRVIPEQLYYIADIKFSPDSVEVYASHEKMDSIRVVYTEPLNYVGFRDTLTVTCKLSHQSDVKVVPEHIKVSFHTDVLTEESIGVPIKCLNLAKVNVNFVAGANLIKSLQAEDFVVVADYLEIEQNPSEKCNIYLRQVPQGISRAVLSTKQVDYLIEDQE